MTTGQTLAHYEIIRPLGKGGMGEVYLAQDTKLKREVAIKVLPDSVRSDAERLKRFRREAEAAAKLNHPNIATIHSIEEDQGELFITMEYVDGKTLAEHIPSGGLDTDQFFEWFIPLSDALAHAHEHGRVHRDLKPANIMIRQDGTPIILDFGLARIEQSESPELDSNAPTKTMKDATPSLTQGKSFLGTPAYMSPEQIEGKQVDARTDIFSLGVVMYEALIGQRPFRGNTVESIIGRILTEEPKSVSDLKSIAPHTLWWTIQKCLGKGREDRIQTAHEMYVDLQRVQQEVQAGTVLVDVRTVLPNKVPLWPQPVAITVMVLMLVIGGGAIWYLKPETEPPLRKFQIPVIEPNITGFWPTWFIQDHAISPDGTMIAYLDQNRLWIRNLDEVGAHEVPDSEGAYKPFWSPDSYFVGYWQASMVKSNLKKAPAQGGSGITITTFPNLLLNTFGSAAWSRDDHIIYGFSGDLWQVPAQDGEPIVLTRPDTTNGELLLRDPLLLPEDRGLIFVMQKADGSYALTVQTMDTRKHLFTSSEWISSPVYAPEGYLLYNRGSSIWAVRFSLSSLTVEGDSFLVVDSGSYPSHSVDGTLTYGKVLTIEQPVHQLVWIDRSGTILDTIGRGNGIDNWGIALSPDSRRLAVSSERCIWTYDIDRGIKSRLTNDRGNVQPVWSPKGDSIVYAQGFSNQFDLMIQASDGSGEPLKLVAEPLLEGAPNWSRNGQWLVYHVLADSVTRRDLWKIPMVGDRTPQPLLRRAHDQIMPVLSPDSRHVTYVSNETGHWEVYVSSFPSGSGRIKVSANGGLQPRWAGNEIFFIEETRLMSARVITGSVLQFEAPRTLFDMASLEIQNLQNQFFTQYDVTEDGRRFVAVRPVADEKTQTFLTVVENWYAEFKDR
jgi:eukaryotic-like serine/threonine-protein kinase